MSYIGIWGRGDVYYKKGKSKMGDDREVEKATALTMGNVAPHNTQVTQRS